MTSAGIPAVAAPGFRDSRYLETRGIYNAGDSVEFDIAFDVTSAQLELLKLSWAPSAPAPELVPIRFAAVRGDRTLRIEIGPELQTGLYLLVARAGTLSFGYLLAVNEANPYSASVDVAVVRPTFTEWGYHRDGFYWNEVRRLPDRLITKATRITRVPDRVTSRVRRTFPRHLRYPYENPANDAILLSRFYETNPRWDSSVGWFPADKLFDSSLFSLRARAGVVAGLWSEDIKSTLPTFALLEKAGLSFRVYSDVDVHLRNPELEAARAVLFFGQELMTSSCFAFLSDLVRIGRPRLVLFGVQGLGYKEVAYDEGSGRLEFLGEKSIGVGLSGERVRGVSPSWGDADGDVFGFTFPVPEPNWRKQYHKLRVLDGRHPLTEGLEAEYKYEVRDFDGRLVPGLTFAGGEYFRKASADARVLACLDDDEEIVGIGLLRNVVVVSPTYWPAFGFYQPAEHPEVITLLTRSIKTGIAATA